MNMINRSYIAVLSITLGLSAAWGANALETSNGLSVNGLSVNGLSVNGLSVNGLSVNGRDAQGTVPLAMQLQAAILQDGTQISLGQ
ncbi:hypothetical protein AA309_13530 [Microvirga vignae]|uniref:Uncharacterized protein n=1 Tax=Microvirga vignae TaxID=1225564 RepID=A0A0H1RBT7_9HYPH|nr:hypothetical protein [Microvirga vignae]KLK92690.1 hypothetical protein AA309_13530 [Microvirga vignae]